MRSLVTGVRSKLAAALIPALHAQGDHVTGLCRDITRYDNPFGIDVLQGDLSTPVELCHFDTVYHLAGLVSYLPSAPFDAFYNNNIVATTNLLNAMVARGIRRLIYFSTIDVYGALQYTPCDESHPLHPDSLYGFSKLSAEVLINTYAALALLDPIVFRLGVVYGKGLANTHFISRLIAQAMTFGRIELHTPTRLIPLVYAGDVALAACRVRSINNGTFNIVGEHLTIRGLVAAIQHALQRPIEVMLREGPPLPRRPLVFSSERLTTAVGNFSTSTFADRVAEMIP